MWGELKDDLGRGIEKLKWVSVFVSDRLRADIAFFKILEKITELEKSKTSLYAEIGEKVYELSASPNPPNVYTNPEISRALRAINELDGKIEELRASAVSTPEG
ncbi:hypothetical protein [Candidatus Magnetomonas plexicatena]|uniref:hypothetical protein n=1 Tax=Candidatus Magnetomonas plexicatena TaxID=2552947 RepID=UPI00110132B8|nr:hypothetical protein E2O03_014885 [Nitrospirales bacterium LBB_01]